MTKAKRKKLSIKMKEVWEKRRSREGAREGQKKYEFEAAKNMIGITPPPDLAMQPVEDRQRSYDFHYRRGLVTALECILRELR
jgi:hypothetical protein